jgi:hypothetical protein
VDKISELEFKLSSLSRRLEELERRLELLEKKSSVPLPASSPPQETEKTKDEIRLGYLSKTIATAKREYQKTL